MLASREPLELRPRPVGAPPGLVLLPRTRCPTPSWRRRRRTTSPSAAPTRCTASTCHDPHNDQFGKFLVKDNRYSALCITLPRDRRLGRLGARHLDGLGGRHRCRGRRRPGRPTRTLASGAARPATRRTSRRPAEQLLNFTVAPPDAVLAARAATAQFRPAPPHSTAPRGAAPRRSRLAAAPAAPTSPRQMRKLVRPPRNPTGALEWPRGAGEAVAATDARRRLHRLPQPAPGERRRGRRLPLRLRALLAGVRGRRPQRRRRDDRPPTSTRSASSATATTRPTATTCRACCPTPTRARAFDPSNPSFHPVIGDGAQPGRAEHPVRISSRPMTPSRSIVLHLCHADDEGGSRRPARLGRSRRS